MVIGNYDDWNTKRSAGALADFRNVWDIVRQHLGHLNSLLIYFRNDLWAMCVYIFFFLVSEITEESEYHRFLLCFYVFCTTDENRSKYQHFGYFQTSPEPKKKYKSKHNCILLSKDFPHSKIVWNQNASDVVWLYTIWRVGGFPIKAALK